MKLSPILREYTGKDVVYIKCVIEVKKNYLDKVLGELRSMGIKVYPGLISQPTGGDYYIPAIIPSDKLTEVSRISGVVMIYKNMIRGVGGVTKEDVSGYLVKDELLGKFIIPDIEVPKKAIIQSALPIALPGSLAYPFTGVNPITNIKIFTTGITASILKDVKTRDGAGVTVAVLDTGSPALVPQFSAKVPNLEQYSLWSEPPFDMMGHGSWCHDCVCGLTFPCPYGMMTGMAQSVERSIHVKVLNTFPGMGTTWQILKGIEIAVKRGANVISMSLGGEAQGTCISDLEAKIVNELSDKGVLFAIAAGNSGYKTYTIGSPGISLKAVTVASASIMDAFKPSWWSSRGLGGSYDKHHTKEFGYVLSKYKDLAIKPDCTATGGGRAKKGDKPDEIIWSGESGWFESFYDGIRDMTGGMHGTSQATPHVAGLLACLLSDGVISSSDDVKKHLKDTASDYIIPDPYNEKDKDIIEKYGKSFATGWGLFKLSRFKR